MIKAPAKNEAVLAKRLSKFIRSNMSGIEVLTFSCVTTKECEEAEKEKRPIVPDVLIYGNKSVALSLLSFVIRGLNEVDYEKLEGREPYILMGKIEDGG